MEHKRDSIAQVIQTQRITDSIKNVLQANQVPEQDITIAEKIKEFK